MGVECGGWEWSVGVGVECGGGSGGWGVKRQKIVQNEK